MRWEGLEPSRLAAHGPQPCLSANSSTERAPKYYNPLEYACQEIIAYEVRSVTRIAVDAMGSDAYPVPDVAGAVMAARELGIEVLLVGNEPAISPVLERREAG